MMPRSALSQLPPCVLIATVALVTFVILVYISFGVENSRHEKDRKRRLAESLRIDSRHRAEKDSI